ncbi:MAG: glycosyl hydrolase [Kiritimatiellae bacterium]|nr:glycosyl hydrolase [Kiritimatiellia bacterium]
MKKKIKTFMIAAVLTSCAFFNCVVSAAAELENEFRVPPDAARPGVYWYFMDGNQNADEMVADLEAMAGAGIGSVLFLEVNIGVPAGPISFMSETWQENLVRAIKTAERLGMEFILGTGPGWSGSGGSWVKAEDSMQHLVGSSTVIKGPVLFEQALPVPAPHAANHFAGMSHAHQAEREQWYQDVAVLAFPTPEEAAQFDGYSIKTLKDVGPYSIWKHTATSVAMAAEYPELDTAKVIKSERIADLTSLMQPDGTLRWSVPEGDWTAMRFVARSTGQTTRPAPRAGHGFECNKFNAAAYRRHWDNYQGRLLQRLGALTPGKGLTTIHLDSWEMSSQNWSAAFRKEFTGRRGYDPQPYYPAYMGMVVDSLEVTERFLWDMRTTAQELVLEQYAGAIKTLAHQHGLKYSNEPYDMNPAGNLDLGSVADIPMCEFWNVAGGADTQYSCIEAVSIAHTMGKPTVKAEAFTTGGREYLNYPGNMKNQTDWAFAIGINGLIFHTFQHQPLGEGVKPGMTMGPYGVQWHRNHTMWHLFPAYHQYITRCSHLLRQGEAVADILYLTPEGAPHIFKAPQEALAGSPRLRDKKGYNFDAVSPRILKMRATVEDGKIAFPEGSRYSVLALPNVTTMTPECLSKIIELVRDGATVIGNPPRKSPSLVGFPECDQQVKKLAEQLWGAEPQAVREVDKGCIVLNPDVQPTAELAKPLAEVAGWIWFDKGSPAHDAAAGDVHLRTTFKIEDIREVESAFVEATADNSFTLQINGRQILSGDNFKNVPRAFILAALRSGENIVTAIANNAQSAHSNPAGFIAALQLTSKAGGVTVIATDQSWQASLDGANWSAAKRLGGGSMAPWGLKGANTVEELYPRYDFIAALLSEKGIPEDFQSDAPLRYGHRRTADEEIYFVANTIDKSVKASCTFRVARGAPQLWDPVTGTTRTLPEFTHQGTTTSLPIHFEAHQSYFIVFRSQEAGDRGQGSGDRGQGSGDRGQGSGDRGQVMGIDGSWEVTFDPKWGGPEGVVFETLQDWTQREESGIKYYSGSAIYRKSFDAPGFSGESIYLDLGTVHDMARVRLNGKDLGVVWCAPWRVNITDVVKSKENQLEIEIVNRWPNRLVGDQQPPDKDLRTLKWESGLLGGREYKTGRYTFTTGRVQTQLLPSGLIGPVRVLRLSGNK